MTEYKVPYGRGEVCFTVPGDVSVVAPTFEPPHPQPETAIQAALEHPLGFSWDAVKGVRSAAIAINDKTRPVPHGILLPPLLAKLESLGLPPEAITLVIAVGAHPPMLPDRPGQDGEFNKVLPPDILARYPVVSHDSDADDLVPCGETSRGTVVQVNRRYFEAELRIVVGNIEPHQFQGFSGGAKSAAIGLTGRATITNNHALMFEPNSQMGIYDDNPARQDVEEIGRLIRVDLALNVILNQQKEIVEALAGNPIAVMKAGIPSVQRIFMTCVDTPFDVVIASPGGNPKDINLYQAQKALAHAARITKPGGTVILAAACAEGVGSGKYQNWMIRRKPRSPRDVMMRFKKEGFVIGPHKAYLFARDQARVKSILVSELDDDLVQQLLMAPFDSVQDAINHALDGLPTDACIGIMPLANATVPTLQDAPES